jgi:hypothetical protein
VGRWCVPCREATFRIIIVVGLMVLESLVVVVGATFEISRMQCEARLNVVSALSLMGDHGIRAYEQQHQHTTQQAEHIFQII